MRPPTALLTPQSYVSGVLVTILATVGSSLSGMFVRFLPELSGWQINCWRGYWMSVSLAIYLVLRYGTGVGDVFRKIPRDGLLTVALFFAVGSTAYVTSLTLTTVATVSALGALSPVFTALLSHAAIRERVSPAAWMAALLALAGVAVVMNEGIAGGHWIGNLVGLFMALCFAGQMLSLRYFRRGRPPTERMDGAVDHVGEQPVEIFQRLSMIRSGNRSITFSAPLSS